MLLCKNNRRTHTSSEAALAQKADTAEKAFMVIAEHHSSSIQSKHAHFADMETDVATTATTPTKATSWRHILRCHDCKAQTTNTRAMPHHPDLIDVPRFSFWLNGDPENEGNGGDIVYSLVRRKAYWETELEGIKFGGESIDLYPVGAAIDTGSPLLIAPTIIAELINRKLGARKNWAGQYVLDCANIKDLPEFCFVFNGRDFCLTAEDYALNIQNQCISGSMGMDIPEPAGALWIVSDVFLRKYYSVYDLETSSVDLA